MAIVSQRVTTIIFLLLAGLSQAAAAGSVFVPSLSNERDYSEYWEQQFLFGDQTIATSQFLIANLPFSKHHGMMVATLKQRGEDTVVIKNGRKRSGWHFEQEEPQLNIYQHKLSATTPGFKLQLHNNSAELDVDFAARSDAISIVQAGNKLGLPEVTLYAPTAEAVGRWRDGPGIGGPGPDGAWHDMGNGFGYGLHVVQQKVPNAVLKRWRRFTGSAATGQYAPILHAFETPKGNTHFALILLSDGAAPIRFEVGGFDADSDGKTWQVKGKADGKILSGTITLADQLETFNLKDQLNSLERLAAGSMADVSRFRYSGTYAFLLQEDGKETELSGRALAEDIHMGEIKAKRRRSRR